MRSRLGALAVVAAVALLGIAAYGRPIDDPNPVASVGSSGSPVAGIRQPPTNAAESQPMVEDAATATSRATGVPARSPKTTAYSTERYISTPCHPGDVAPWISDQFVQWSAEGDQVLFTHGAVLYALIDDGAWLREVARGYVAPPRGRTDVIGTMMAFDISPDGKQVAYSTCEYSMEDTGRAVTDQEWNAVIERHHYQIAVAAIDRTRPQRLTNYIGFDNYPAWSPDGERIAYLSGGDPIYGQNSAWLMTMAADGSDPGGIVNGFESLALRPPRWSPGGTHLAFAGDDGESGLSIYTVRADGTDLRRLAATLSVPEWSPDGERIAFAKADGPKVAIYTIAADGTDERRVTTVPEVGWGSRRRPMVYIRTIEWSPDGSKILFVENRKLVGGYCGSPTTYGIYVVGADGSGLVGLGMSEPQAYQSRVFWYGAAAWSPDGSRIAVSAEGHSDYRHLYGCDYTMYAAVDGAPRPLVLFTMAADGTDVEVLALTDKDGSLVGTWTSYDDVAGNVAACSEGLVVAEPEANPGLVRDCETLIRLRDALFARPTTNWWAAVPIENWMGVSVEGSPARVTGLTLGGMGMGGIIPSLLGELSELRVLDLSRSKLGRAIPSGLGGLKKLERLDLSDNELWGAIPAELDGLTNLEQLDLSGNRLTVVIPMELEQLTSLKELDLSGNELVGCISAGLRAIESNDLEDLSLPDCEAVESDGEVSKPTVAAAVEQAAGDPSPARTRSLDSGSTAGIQQEASDTSGPSGEPQQARDSGADPGEDVQQRATERQTLWWPLLTMPLALAMAVILRMVLRGRRRS